MLLKPTDPDVEPETAASPPRINGVRRPPKQAQPNASLSVMQQQMTDRAIVQSVYPAIVGHSARKSQSSDNAATNINAVPLCSHCRIARHCTNILKLYWQRCNTACAGLANSSGA
jgi:hypothetical protein